MCISFFVKEANPFHKFVLIFNREEFFNRETTWMGFHCEDPEFKDKLLFPLDVLSNGTFLCVNVKNGNFCILLNNSFSSNPYNSSLVLKRGSIAIDFCKLDTNIDSFYKFISVLQEQASSYNGYNIICGNMVNGALFYFTNNNPDNYSLPLQLQSKQVYGVSNYFISESVDRIKHGTEIISSLVSSVDESSKDKFILDLFKTMQDDKRFVNVDVLKENSMDKNLLINKPLKQFLASSIYVSDKLNDLYVEYGTRHTVCFVMDYHNNLSVYEYFDEIVKKEDTSTVQSRDLTKIKKYDFVLS